MRKRTLLGACLMLVIGAVTFAGGSAVAMARSQAVGALDLRGVVRLSSSLGACPAGAAGNTCGARTIVGPLPGLGQVQASYTWIADIGPPTCAEGLGKALAYPIRVAVASKGEIQLAVAQGAECVGQEPVRTQAQAFTITGGTGMYAGASGSGTFEQSLGGDTGSGRVGRQIWTGTLAVPGLDFDVTPPTLAGATNKTVRAKKGAKSARVAFRVTAQDDRDPSVTVTCTPKSGSRFKIGRTRVGCEATDTSANTATVTFTVTVKRPKR